MKLLRMLVGLFPPAGRSDKGKGKARKVGAGHANAGKGIARKGSGMEKVPAALRSRAEKWAEAWGVPGLTSSVTLEFSRRLRSSLGNCRPRQSLIRLAAHLEKGNEDLLEEVLCHELAHVAVYRRYGRSVRPHGREWKSLISAAGFEPRVRFQRSEGRFPPRP